ncbi:MAG: Rid family detoxifying hydrolase [Thermomicrobiales bacterium]
MTTRSIISTDRAPAAIGPYNQAVVANGLVYTAGVIPLDPETMKVVEGGIDEQATRVLASLAALLEDAGSSTANVIKTTCFLANLDDFPAFNSIYATVFDAETAPARSTVQVARLPMGALVEVEAIATLS